MYIVIVKKGVALQPKNEKEFEEQQKDPSKVKYNDAYVSVNKKDITNFISVSANIKDAEQFDKLETAKAIKAYVDSISVKKMEVVIAEVKYEEVK